MTSTPGQDRDSGFREGIKGAAIDIVFDADMKWLEPEARKEMESALAVHPEKESTSSMLNNDPGAHGAYLAARASGREKDILFVGIDGLPQEGRAYVKQGILAASFEYPTGGAEAIDAALKILGGGKTPERNHFEVPARVHEGERRQGRRLAVKTKRYALGIDFGTESVRALLVDCSDALTGRSRDRPERRALCKHGVITTRVSQEQRPGPAA